MDRIRSRAVGERSRAGFKLIELVVVVFILAVTLALLLPALVPARINTRQGACANNLKQLSIATQTYHDYHSHLPAAQINDRGTDGHQARHTTDADERGPNWVVLMLPHIEQQVLYDAFKVDPAATSTGEMWDEDAVLEPTQGVLARSMTWDMIQCPSDTGHDVSFNGVGGNWGRGNYAINAGPCTTGRGKSSMPCEFGLKGAGAAGINFGPKLDLLARQDGTSHTILFTELRVGPAPEDVRGTWALGWPGASLIYAGATFDANTPNAKYDGSDNVEGCDESKTRAGGSARLAGLGLGCCNCNDENSQATARSAHVGESGAGVNACFADCSVRFISNSVSHRIWYKMLSRNDGEPPGE